LPLFPEERKRMGARRFLLKRAMKTPPAAKCARGGVFVGFDDRT